MADYVYWRQSFMSSSCWPQVIAHMMPDLPNVGWERDVESFTEFFENPAFRTDGLKLYPTLVIRGTGLYELWKAGLYRNYDPALLVELVSLWETLEGIVRIAFGKL